MAAGRLLCVLVCCWSLMMHHVQTATTNPGLKIRLSQPGLNYAATVAVQQMSSKVHGASLPDQGGESHTPVGKVHYEVKNTRVGSGMYTSYSYSFIGIGL